GYLYDTFWTGSNWQTSQNGGSGNVESAHSALYGFSAGRMDIFWVGRDGNLWDTWWTGTHWQDSKLGGHGDCLPVQPSALYGFESNRMDIFWKSMNGYVVNTWWNSNILGWQDT